MNNPVLLPKRKEFGFLKPPSASSQLSNVTKRINSYNTNNTKTNRSDLTGKSGNTVISHFGNPMATSISTPDLPYNNKSSNTGFNYSFDPLKLRYEIKDHSIGNKPTTANHKSNEINPDIVSKSKDSLLANNALVSSFSKKKPLSSGSRKRDKKNFNELREAHFDRQAYKSDIGTNVKKKHQFLSIPYKRTHQNASIQSNYDLIGPEITGSDTGFAASRLVVKREKTSIANCSKCGKLYYDYKCLNCEFGKKKFQFNWRPQNLRTKEILKNRFAGYTSVSSFSGVDANLNALNRPALARTAVSDNFEMSGKLSKPLTAATNKSNISNNLVINKILNENKKFSEFDMSFKYDFSSNTINDQKSQKSAKSEREASEQAKLTLYLI